MSTFYLPPIRRTPASGVAPRPVPNQMAPECCVTSSASIDDRYAVLIGRDLSGRVRIKVELAADDVSSWWLRVIRHWLAWQYGASEIKLVK